MTETQEHYSGVGYECHDCGEVYPIGASIEACTKEGHYVGMIKECSLPAALPISEK
jgi:hypothetical protein